MLEQLLPFSQTHDAEVTALMVCIQKHFRGMRGRTHAARKRSLARGIQKWLQMSELLHEAQRMRTAAMVRALQESSATIVQHAYRAYVKRWTRPRVSALLRTTHDLELKLEQTSKALDVAVRRLANSQSSQRSNHRKRKSYIKEDASAALSD